MKSEYLECGTALDYTPLMVASECGHTDITRMLEAKGCSMESVNMMGKSAKKLVDDLRREEDWAAIRPWDRGNILHLSAENVEAHLDRRKARARTRARMCSCMHACTPHAARVDRYCARW